MLPVCFPSQREDACFCNYIMQSGDEEFPTDNRNAGDDVLPFGHDVRPVLRLRIGDWHLHHAIVRRLVVG